MYFQMLPRHLNTFLFLQIIFTNIREKDQNDDKVGSLNLEVNLLFVQKKKIVPSVSGKHIYQSTVSERALLVLFIL